MYGLRIDADIKSEVGTIYTDSPKFLINTCGMNDILETGITYIVSPVKKVIDDDFLVSKMTERRYIPLSSPEETTFLYEKALKVIRVDELDTALEDGKFIDKLQERVVHFDIQPLAILALMSLIAKNYPMLMAGVLGVGVCTQVDLKEAYVMLRELVMREKKKEALRSEVFSSDVSEILIDKPASEDILMYTKINRRMNI